MSHGKRGVLAVGWFGDVFDKPNADESVHMLRREDD